MVGATNVETGGKRGVELADGELEMMRAISKAVAQSEDRGGILLDALLVLGCLSFGSEPELSSLFFQAFIERAPEGKLRNSAREALFAIIVQGCLPAWRIWNLANHRDRHVHCAACFGGALLKLAEGCGDAYGDLARFAKETPGGWHAHEAELLLAALDDQMRDEKSCCRRCRKVLDDSTRDWLKLFAAKMMLEHCDQRLPEASIDACIAVASLGGDSDRIAVLRDYAVPWFRHPWTRCHSLRLVAAVADAAESERVRRAASLALAGFARVLQGEESEC